MVVRKYHVWIKTIFDKPQTIKKKKKKD